VNRAHLLAFLWLRWRLRVNQFRKAGALNAVIVALFMVATASAAVGLAVVGFLVGLLAFPHASPGIRLIVWDGAIVVFLFFWLTGLMTDLQRSEALAIDKVLHLPVSPSGAFVVNYLSSLFSLTLAAFVPGMVGLILGEVCAGSAVMLLALPLLAAFLFSLTTVTYQFRGWLAAIMANPRRKRTVIVLMTIGFVLLVQVPNLLNMAHPWRGGTPDALNWWNEKSAADRADLEAKKITFDEYVQRSQEAHKEFAIRQEAEGRRVLEEAERTARLFSLIIPPGWLALGVSELAAGGVIPALLGTLAFGLVGTASLWRAYRTTLRLYTGEFTGQGRRSVARAAIPTDPDRVRLVEWRLPWVSEYASAVAVAMFRSLMRAPESKMILLTPIAMLVVFGTTLLTAKEGPLAALRPLIAFGAGATSLFGGLQLIGNQFGYDRAGFRAFVLSPIPRREILLGRNLAVAPFTLGFGLVMLLLTGVVYPMRIDHYPAAVLQLVSAYLLLCLLANALSILAPIPIAAGSFQPSHIKLIPILLQMVTLLVIPIIMIPVLMPIGVEVLLAEQAGVRGGPVSLILSLIVFAITVPIYRVVLRWEGHWLASWERRVLEAVTSAEK
jgi:ABC-2 type transport system permease protein